jgi:septin family protein
MSDTHVRLDADTFRLMIVGEFKRGKSTLINAMLGDNVLPAKVAPCTGLITEVKWGDEPSAVLHPDEGEPRTIAVDEVRDYVVIDPDREGERLP